MRKVKKNVAELLKEKAELFQRKSEEYGYSYLQYGDVMTAIFPNGMKVRPGDVDTWNRFGIYSMMVHKMLRLANTSCRSIDSVKDIQVYGAMLESIMEG